MSKCTQNILFIIFFINFSLKIDGEVKWGYVELFWPLWMCLVLIVGLFILVLIFNAISCKLLCKKKITFDVFIIGFIVLIFSFLMVSLFIANTILLVDYLDNGKSAKMIQIGLYYLVGLFLFMFFFTKIFIKNISMFLYKIIFHEEDINLSLQDVDFADEESFDRRKAYKKSRVDVNEVPNFVQKFTDTYFKIKPKKMKVIF